MIIVKIIGGLGNQMYQYAMGRHLAELNSTILKLDATSFEAYRLHRYALCHFNIQEHFATVEEIYALKRKRWFRESETLASIKRKLMIIPKTSDKFYLNNTYVYVKPFFYDPDIINLRGHIYLEGSWQSYQYYQPIREILLREFTVKYPPNEQNKRITEQIRSTQSIGIHIRRGDKANDPTTNSVHGTCSKEYYNKAVECILQRVENPVFFVFSDDCGWAKKNLRIQAPLLFVDHNNASNCFEDLRLMSCCKHNIIANSSFSVWAAWLNMNEQKIVIGPSNHYSPAWKRKLEEAIPDPEKREHLMPETWIKLDY